MNYTAAQCAKARPDFPALACMLDGRPLAYLDGPGGTQIPRTVLDAIGDCYVRCNVNVGGAFGTSREVGAVVESARAAVADFLGAPGAQHISFGPNMTTLAFALSRALGRGLVAGDEVVITALDHEANRGPWLRLAECGAIVREVALGPDGELDLADLVRQVTPRTRIIAFGLASNALGTVPNVALAARLARELDACLVVDAVHYAAHFPVDAVALDCDFLLCSAYKFYGPHVGILYSRDGRLEALDTDRLRTQKQTAPHRIETGTLNHPALAGVTAAIDYLARWGSGGSRRARLLDAMRGIAAYEHALAARYYADLRAIPGVTVYGPDFTGDARAPTVSIAIEGVPAATAAEYAGTRGLQVWHGHFYALRVIETLDLLRQGGLIRAGVSMYNTAEELARLATAVEELAGGARGRSGPK